MSSKRKYIRIVSDNIRCFQKDKAAMLSKLRASIDEVYPSEPTYEQLVQSFGEPKQIARELSSLLPDGAMKKYRQIRITAMMLLIAAAILFAVFFYSYNAHLRHARPLVIFFPVLRLWIDDLRRAGG